MKKNIVSKASQKNPFVLEIKDLVVECRSNLTNEKKILVDNVSFSVRAGECFSLLGESGSGKTLTALSITRLLPSGLSISQGQVIFEGMDLLRQPSSFMQKIRGLSIGFIFQEPMVALNPVMSVAKQIEEILHLRFKISNAEKIEKSCNLLLETGIEDVDRVLHSYPHELSGGMKQRVMIAMMLAGDPKFLIADSPTKAVVFPS